MWKSINPATGQVIRSWPVLSTDELAARLETASLEFRTWSRVPLGERSSRLGQLGQRMFHRRQDLAELMTQEMGKPITQSLAEVEKCVSLCNYYAEHASEILETRQVSVPDKRCYVRFDPLGAILAVMPWNFPFWQVFRQAAPAIVAGNVVLLKHAANVPGCATAIEDLFRQAGFSPGVFTSLLIEHDQVATVLNHSSVQAVSLTGSEKAAAAVASQAAKKIKKSILELGGSDPFIVLADADLDQAAEQAVLARTINSGQSCIAAKRFLVSQNISDEFTERFLVRMKALSVGDPMDTQNDLGPLARGDLVETLHDQVQRSVASGAKLACGGSPRNGPGYYYPPTLLTDVQPGMAAFDEETFGPVAAISTVDDDEEQMIALANQTPFGLGASLWTQDLERAQRMAASLQCGSVFINQIVQSDPHLPFGGVKLSGYGRELGEFGLREFTNIKTVCVG